MMNPPVDFARSPLLVFYELTRACDLVCRHCRACAQPRRHPRELSTAQSRALIDQLTTFAKPPLLVLTGGDPFKRPDLFDLIHHARQQGLVVALTPSATPLVTRQALARLKQVGLHRLALSLDGAQARTHDAFRGFAGSFERTLEILREARELGLSLQINTTVTQGNQHELEPLGELLEPMGIAMWSVFFLIPVGRGRAEHRLSGEQCEAVFQRLWDQAQHRPYAIKTTEAPHYRRFVLERVGSEARGEGSSVIPPMAGVRDGQGVMFISHTGQIFPSGFLPMERGRFPRDSVVRTYQDDELFRRLRDAEQLKGKCGACEYRQLCGGSRARAYAVSGDPMQAEPDCAYIPAAWSERARCGEAAL